MARLCKALYVKQCLQVFSNNVSKVYLIFMVQLNENKQLIQSKKITTFRRIFSPFHIVTMHRAAFFVWLMFTLFGGLAGVAISIMRHLWFENTTYTFKEALYIETVNGSLYTYAIATIAAVLSGLFVLFAEKEKLNYRTLQIPTAALAVFVLLFGGVFYALNINTSNTIVVPPKESIILDWKQIIVMALALFFSIYAFCLCRIDDHVSEFEDIKDSKFYKNNISLHQGVPSNEMQKK